MSTPITIDTLTFIIQGKEDLDPAFPCICELLAHTAQQAAPLLTASLSSPRAGCAAAMHSPRAVRHLPRLRRAPTISRTLQIGLAPRARCRRPTGFKMAD